MKKNRVDEILLVETKRRRIVLSYISIITIVSIIFISLLLISINQNKAYYINYNENSNIDYKVYLKENEFYKDNYLEKDNQYIASIIDYISADFNYQLSLEKKDVEFSYTYRIDAEINVKEKNTNNPIYNYKDTLVAEKKQIGINSSNISVKENVIIDYNKYNDHIKKFINIYDLENTESSISVKMYINVIGSCEDFEEESNDETIISLDIPLTTKTVGIDIGRDLVNDVENIMVCKDEKNYTPLIIILDVIILLINIALITRLMKYIITTRTAKSIYDNELKKILNNYRSYIQKINNEFELTGYQVLKVDTFTDMLEIRDTIQEPILMVENKTKTGVYFLIPSKTKILYSYGLKVSDIKKSETKKRK